MTRPKYATADGKNLDRNRLRRRATLVACGSLLTTALAGCQLLETEEPPPPVEDLEIVLEGIRPPDPGLTNATMTLILGISNPTNREIPSPEFEYELFVNGVKGADSRLAMATIPPGDSITETIEAVLEYVDVGAGIKRAIDNRRLEVTLAGSLRSEGATRETSFTRSLSW